MFCNYPQSLSTKTACVDSYSLSPSVVHCISTLHALLDKGKVAGKVGERQHWGEVLCSRGQDTYIYVHRTERELHKSG